MSKARKPIQLAPWSSALLGNFDWAGLGDDPIGDMQVFAGAATASDLQARLRSEIETEVSAMLHAIQDFDAFDIIELIRLRELPIVPVAALVHGHDGNGAAIGRHGILRAAFSRFRNPFATMRKSAEIQGKFIDFRRRQG